LFRSGTVCRGRRRDLIDRGNSVQAGDRARLGGHLLAEDARLEDLDVATQPKESDLGVLQTLEPY
jgi:hypothetical protein